MPDLYDNHPVATEEEVLALGGQMPTNSIPGIEYHLKKTMPIKYEAPLNPQPPQPGDNINFGGQGNIGGGIASMFAGIFGGGNSNPG